MMARVTGIGGVFFRARDPEALYRWYEQHLGVTREPDGSVLFRWDCPGETAFSFFPHDTTYFGSGMQSFMINFRVDDLDTLLSTLATEGVEIDPNREEYPFGTFAWIVDPEGNRIELWEPPAESVTDPSS
jgi:predicted enzyme related to lactoylglutathione lyase